MTHKPKINKYLWLSAGKSWRFTTSTRHKLVVLFVFALCILPANLCGQSLAIKSNLLYDLTTSLNLGGEIRCDVVLMDLCPSDSLIISMEIP